MSAAAKTVAPSHAHKSSSAPSSSSTGSGANRTANDIIEQVRAAEVGSSHPRSHAGSLVLANKDGRSLGDVNAEIAALEVEARDLERKALEKGSVPMYVRERPLQPEYEVFEHRRVYARRPRCEEDIVFSPARPRYAEDDLVLLERSRGLGRAGEQIFITPAIRRDDLVLRRKGPARNIIRVEKDRKGRMALVRSAN